MDAIDNSTAEDETTPAMQQVHATNALQQGQQPSWVLRSAPVLLIGRSSGTNTNVVEVGSMGPIRVATNVANPVTFSFRSFFRCFVTTCTVGLVGCFMLVVMAAGVFGPCGLCFLYAYAWVIWLQHMNDICDEHLDAWLGTYLLYTVLTWCYRRSIVRVLCRWNPDELHADSPPRRIRYLGCFNVTLHFGWMLYGHWILKRSKTCNQTSHGLFWFVDWYSWIGSFFYGLLLVWLLVGAAGHNILLWMARNGMLHWVPRQSATGASPGTIEEMEVVSYDPEMFADPLDQEDTRPQGECCICLEMYSEEKEIKRTRCGHLMHRECLEIWLRAARTCPTCRSDLEVQPVAGTSEVPEAP